MIISVSVANDGNVFAGETFQCVISISNRPQKSQTPIDFRGRASSIASSKAPSRRTSGFFSSPQVGEFGVFSINEESSNTWEGVAPPGLSRSSSRTGGKRNLFRTNTGSSVIYEDIEIKPEGANSEKILDMKQFEPNKSDNEMLPPPYAAPRYAPLTQQSSSASMNPKSGRNSRPSSATNLLGESQEQHTRNASSPAAFRPPNIAISKSLEYPRSEYILYAFAQLSGKIYMDPTLIKTSAFETLKNVAVFQSVSYDSTKSSGANGRLKNGSNTSSLYLSLTWNRQGISRFDGASLDIVFRYLSRIWRLSNMLVLGYFQD